MITAAHIGIGISGLEGQQAARAADYSIGQFKFLKNLLVVHGREAYRRNSYLILYMFYKNVIYVMPIFFFGLKSLFSGTQIYDVYLYNAYNIFFTGLPIGWFAVCDWQYTKQELLSNMKHYSIGLENKCFNPFRFWTWYFMAVWQGAVLLFTTFYTLDESSGEQYTSNLFFKDQVNGGKTISGSLVVNGLFIFQAIVVLVNIKLFIQTSTHTLCSVFLQVISIVLFYAMFYFLSSQIKIENGDLFNTFPILMSFANQYMLLFFFMTSYILIEKGQNMLEQEIRAIQEEYDEKLLEKRKAEIQNERSKRGRKITKY
jgi:phospholipid-transporting ATPase